MKKLLIASFFTLAASLAYAGGSCCEEKSDCKDKDAGNSCVAEACATLACGGDKDGDSKDKDSGKSCVAEACATLACGGDKDGDSKDKDSGKSGVTEASSVLAGSGCCGDKGDKDDKSCDKKAEGFVLDSALV
ncbi:MAG: hypothetical protein ACOCVJ_02220 [Verrucomicrobiota bacterium]